MLVLSRGENDRIVFPTLGISVEVLKVKGSRASIGIDAPKSVRVVRHELMTDEDSTKPLREQDSEETQRLRHEFRNHINRATLKLQLAAKMLSAGNTPQGLTYLTAGIAELSAISNEAGQVKMPERMTLAESKATFEISGAPKGKRVLLVDDDPNERALMASYLGKCGLQVEQASDGLKALYALSHNRQPDVVLLDMNMPNLGGRETVERIRKCSQHPNVPVFAVTGESFDQSGVSIGDEGVTAWFQKPVQVDEIVDAIESRVVTHAD